LPLYDYKCPYCHKVERDLQYKINEKPTFILCEACGDEMIQVVAPLRFNLTGNGWYEQGYGITDMESKANLEHEKKIEERASDYLRKDREAQKSG
jgi:predicted nucleic acid-binding Zn ribbon protein